MKTYYDKEELDDIIDSMNLSVSIDNELTPSSEDRVWHELQSYYSGTEGYGKDKPKKGKPK